MDTGWTGSALPGEAKEWHLPLKGLYKSRVAICSYFKVETGRTGQNQLTFSPREKSVGETLASISQCQAGAFASQNSWKRKTSPMKSVLKTF